jgi:ATP dependent DNA ligase domain
MMQQRVRFASSPDRHYQGVGDDLALGPLMAAGAKVTADVLPQCRVPSLSSVKPLGSRGGVSASRRFPAIVRHDHEVTLIAFDLIKWQGDDLRNQKLIDRKQRLAKMLARGGAAITYNEHLAHDGPAVFEHACRLGLEGIVSKRLNSPYRSGPSKVWPLSGFATCADYKCKHAIWPDHVRRAAEGAQTSEEIYLQASFISILVRSAAFFVRSSIVFSMKGTASAEERGVGPRPCRPRFRTWPAK